MPMRKILLTITGILIWTSGQTCDCDYYIGNFLTTSKWAELIFIVKVKGHGDYGSLTGAAPPDTVRVPLTATFEILRTLKGNTDKKDIWVFGTTEFCVDHTLTLSKKTSTTLLDCIDAQEKKGTRQRTTFKLQDVENFGLNTIRKQML
jgi:hypothetical protein